MIGPNLTQSLLIGGAILIVIIALFYLWVRSEKVSKEEAEKQEDKK